MNVPFVGCSVDGYRGCNKLGQVCNFRCMDGAQVELAESTNNTSGMIHPLPCMIMWLKLTALIGLMGKLHLPIPHSLPTSHSFGFWVTPQIPLVPSQNDTALLKEPQFVLQASSPKVWSTF